MVIPWYIYFVLGFFLGGIVFNKKLRTEVMGMFNKNVKKPEVTETKNAESTKQMPTSNDERVVSGHRRRGVTIREIHLDDD